MTSVKNDAFTIGTAAVAAGSANIIIQNQEAVKNFAIGAGTIAKEAKDAFVKSTKASGIKKSFENIKDKLRAALKPEAFKNAKDAIENATKATFSKDTWKNLGEKVSGTISEGFKKFSAVDWKTAGKYAGIAAAVATAAVIAKNILFDKKDA